MSNISCAAGKHFGQMLAKLNVPNHFVFRVFLKDPDIRFKLDTIRLGDTSFKLGRKTVLVIDEQTLDILEDMQFVIQVFHFPAWTFAIATSKGERPDNRTNRQHRC